MEFCDEVTLQYSPSRNRADELPNRSARQWDEIFENLQPALLQTSHTKMNLVNLMNMRKTTSSYPKLMKANRK
jgi:hypothetical protein